jgi:hypothetical protein
VFGKKKVPAPAVILVDEGYNLSSNGPTSAKQHEKYIVEVHPEGAAPFRVEVKAWVDWPSMPQVGDTVTVLWEPGTQKVELALEGDPRYDAKLRKQQQAQADAARREELLSAPIMAPQPAAAAPPSQAQTGFCSSCGQPHGPGDAFCPRCGHRLI